MRAGLAALASVVLALVAAALVTFAAWSVRVPLVRVARAAEPYAHSWSWKTRPSDEAVARCIADMQRLVARRPDLVSVVESSPVGLRLASKAGGGDFVFPGSLELHKLDTARAPYDELVTAALLVARDHFGPDALEIRSDGTWLQWQDGILLYTEAFQRAPKNPGLVEGPAFRPGGRMHTAPDRLSSPRGRLLALVIAACLAGLLVLWVLPTRPDAG